ncbi:hypothetical protein JCGZ_12357 [Jatropha curcas]|uniref:WEB family protein n=1 Tax=Jatropha curcas TaxID=180498 RepID=A0A067K6M9_JATCU|nr:hypothetical protein JCGZ_12357 [Jatropha curcas]
MESYQEQRRELEKQPGDDTDDHHQEKMAELIEIREELYKAKDKAMQSWLDSKPLIDELEKLQADLASAKNRVSMSKIIISELESQLKATDIEIRSKMEAEAKAKNMINEITKAIEQKYEEAEALKLDWDEERKTRSKLKKVVHVRRQTLRALQLTLRAVRTESEAFGASEAEAKENINSLLETGNGNAIVRVENQEYFALTKRDKEEKALAKWRVSVSMERKHAAEESRNFALSRLKELERTKSKEGKIIAEEQGEEERISANEVNTSGNAFPKTRAKAITKAKWKKEGKTKGKSARKTMKKKLSIFRRIRGFLVRSIGKLFR